MGLLDKLTNLDEHQNKGLLAAAAEMLARSGPSRTPTSLGQIVGGGMMAFQEGADLSKRRALQEQEAQQVYQMRQQDMDAQASATQKQVALQDAYRQAGGDPTKLVEAVDQIDPMKAWEMRAAMAPKPVEYDTTERVGLDENNQPIKYLLSKTGERKVLEGVRPRDELEFRDGGDVVYGLNKFTGDPVKKLRKGQSPDSAASVGAQYANAAATRSIAEATRDAARIARDQQTEMKMGDDYRKQSQTFKDVGDAYRTINATLDKATMSPAATLAGATKFMKLLDPGSVVRESELGMALAAEGVFDRALNYHNTLLRGKVLTPTQVADFKNITKQIYSAAQQGQQAIDQNYRRQAETYGLRPDMIIQDLGQNISPNINPKAIAHLKMNPKLRDQFDAKFGAGAAASVLGK